MPTQWLAYHFKSGVVKRIAVTYYTVRCGKVSPCKHG